MKVLLTLVGLANCQPRLQNIASRLAKHDQIAMPDLVELDKKIPGLGLHNFAVERESVLRGVWRKGDRQIFRPIYYVWIELQNPSIEWHARSIVTMSCLHVENSLKRRLKIGSPLSIGMILNCRKARCLDADLVEVLSKLNKAVYNKSKHSIESTYADGHTFSIADSLAAYLICRTLGSRILKDSGITTEYDQPVFD